LPLSRWRRSPKDVQASKAIQEVLEEFKDVMPAKLHKKLPTKREVDYTIKLEPKPKPPLLTPYVLYGTFRARANKEAIEGAS